MTAPSTPSTATPAVRLDRVAESFSRSATTYEAHARVQQRVASHALRSLTCKPADKVLDVGCGTGIHTAALAARGAKVHGLDMADGMVALAARRYPDIAFQVGEAEAMPFQTETFDWLFSSMALQWCASPLQALSECRRVLKPGGQAVLAIMVAGSFAELEQARRVAGLGRRSNPQASHEHWRQAALQAGFTVRDATQTAYTDTHPTLLDLLRSIRNTGAGVTASPGKSLTRQDLQKLAMTYRALNAKATGFPLTYRVSHLILEK
ncbi:methyltransferase domain-containing protein [Alteromonas sp. ASW11-19]|uniref:Malonyl-[acyl-carrier protein] O-methyltransferase n=1 Tax=Alteromonas salexigens TaxID=2982530 RepID=A0ABT2VTR8_9ALTE|nr:methyltransferase domain-containing protein [Alteromonas salexigens]MCU7555254.1 methyltransferase domain-containing protein [Alteromonas salexigens]